MSLLVRYRPTKRFNPYIGGGLGYLFVGFKESPRWREISDQLEGSLVSDVIPTANRSGLNERSLAEFSAIGYDLDNDGANERLEVLQLGHRLKRPDIATPNTVFAELRGGFELQFSPKWAVIGETKFNWAKKRIDVTVDGKDKFGQPTPDITVDYKAQFPTTSGINPLAFPNGGLPAYIILGGLRQPAYDPALPGGNPIPGPDGRPYGIDGQPGQYYVNGGRMKYGGWVFTLGLRYTL
jgi:hypothetical protein